MNNWTPMTCLWALEYRWPYQVLYVTAQWAERHLESAMIEFRHAVFDRNERRLEEVILDLCGLSLQLNETASAMLEEDWSFPENA